jgi:hypothetical protein
MAADQVEHRKTVVGTNDCLAVYDAGSDRQRLDCRGGQREAVRQVATVSR